MWQRALIYNMYTSSCRHLLASNLAFPWVEIPASPFFLGQPSVTEEYIALPLRSLEGHFWVYLLSFCTSVAHVEHLPETSLTFSI